MATLAIPKTRTLVSPRALALAALVIGLAGLVLGWSGSSWDVGWHRALGRDTFWSPPHIAMYVGTSLVGLSALVAIASVMRGRPTVARELAIGPFHVERSLAAVGFGALVIMSAAPIDDLWHRAFGRDVDIWSPPHLVAVAGALVAYTGLAAAVSSGFVTMQQRSRDALVAILLAGTIGTFVFGMNFFYIFAWSRDAVLYPLIVSATIPFALAIGVDLIGRRFAASAVALAYTAFNVVTFLVLRALDWPAPAFAPLVIAGAIAVDLVRERTRSAVLIGLAFVVAFVVAEGVRMLVTDPLPSAAVLTDKTVGHLATQYWAMASARPWLAAWPLLGIIGGVPLAIGSWLLGRVAARSLVSR